MYWKLVLTAVLAGLGGLLVGKFWGSSRDEQRPRDGEGPKVVEEPRRPGKGPKVVLVIHGGAGVLDENEMKEAGRKAADYEEALAAALRAGWAAMRKGTSVDGVEQAIRSMEDSKIFNAGKGAALSADGQARLDAAIMEGWAKPPAEGGLLGKRDPRLRAGAVADVLHINHPISAARAVLEMEGQRVVLLVGEGAEKFALTPANCKRFRLERVPNKYFQRKWRRKLLRDTQEREKKRAGRAGAASHFGTVGAVACKDGTLAAGTSTGGLTNKPPGRVGDSPLIGSGTYADDRACAVSCTGTGEVFIRHAVAHDVVARMLYSRPRPTVAEAAQAAIDALPDEEGGVGSLIALDTDGNHFVAMSEKLAGTYRGYVTADGEVFVGALKGPMKSMGQADRPAGRK
jgi:beta-aspartyl-peptidase (threonine type)